MQIISIHQQAKTISYLLPLRAHSLQQ